MRFVPGGWWLYASARERSLKRDNAKQMWLGSDRVKKLKDVVRPSIEDKEEGIGRGQIQRLGIFF
ncbi:phage terminase small subunit-related protein [Paenibacillus polymyxa]|uniref:phage terminase small subunit-related protein n=1 Tax=Paenibacillus polymyxa TaxID=1406 RepID=UPI003D767389